MPESTTSLNSSHYAKGGYCPAASTDIRSPCPILNSLANHGYLPRDGRNVRVNDFTFAMKQVGLSHALGATLSNPIFIEREADGKPQQRSFFAKVWYYLQNPWAIVFSAFGVRSPGQKDSMGKPCLNLDQLSIPGVIEHDISLSRRDYAQGDNHTMQPDLVKALLASSSDGGKTLSAEDLIAFRQRRIEEQKVANAHLSPGAATNSIGNGEIGFILGIFGDGKKIKCDHVRAIFMEERLPVNEGWTKRTWTMGIVELVTTAKKIGALVSGQS
ncbi:putative Chloroperoxidase [Seiridium cardinale]|uniref:Chloroperoxidase n=1 Tax=Seiridium cardinale TaxID=138064 RepID=A0ABR2XMV9_9PEZI